MSTARTARMLLEVLEDDHAGDKPHEYHYFAPGDLVTSNLGLFDGLHSIGMVTSVDHLKYYVVCSPVNNPPWSFTTFTMCSGANLTHVKRCA